MRKALVLLIASVAILFLGLGTPTHLLPSWTTTRGSVSVSPTVPHTVSHYLTWGSQVKGYIFIEGGNDDLYFYIMDSEGNIAFDAGTVHDADFLYWEVPKNDYFRFVFDNSLSWITTKEVAWKFEFYFYTISLFVVGIVLLIISIALLVRSEVILRRKREPQAIK